MAREYPVDVVLEELEKAGLHGEVQKNKHIKVWFEVAGHRCLYVCSSTPSDNRTIMNTRCSIRRLIRQATSQLSHAGTTA